MNEELMALMKFFGGRQTTQFPKTIIHKKINKHCQNAKPQ
jgi:hypothetical protein